MTATLIAAVLSALGLYAAYVAWDEVLRKPAPEPPPLDRIRDAYAEDRIDADEMERQIGQVLAGTYVTLDPAYPLARPTSPRTFGVRQIDNGRGETVEVAGMFRTESIER